MSNPKHFPSVRWNPRLQRMEPTIEAQDGTILAIGDAPRRSIQQVTSIEYDAQGAPVAIVCRDRTRRPIHRTGLEGVTFESHRQAKLPLIAVTITKRAGVSGRRQVEAILGGMNINFTEFVGYHLAKKMYGYRDRDECQKTFAGQLAAAGEQ